MGRGKIKMSRIENRTARQVTFSKRRAGLLKKTRELSVLCDVQIGLLIFSSSGKLSQYCSDSTSMEELIRRYQLQTVSGNRLSQHSDAEMWNAEIRKFGKETRELHLTLKRYTGEDLTGLRFEDLDVLEHQLEVSIDKIRARKFEIMQQEIQNLRLSCKQKEDENGELCHLFEEHQAALFNHQQQMEMAPKSVEHRHRYLMEQFPFCGEEQPLLQLATASMQPQFASYHASSSSLQPSSSSLQPNQPHLHDFSFNTPPLWYIDHNPIYPPSS